MKIKTKRGDKAVSEIVGTILLLAIAICVFSVVYMNVLSEDGPNPETYATIVGKIEAEDLVFEHRSGETLDLDSIVILRIAGQRQPPKTLRELLDQSSQSDYLWNIGERISIPLQSFGIGRDENVRVAGEIYDEESNSLIFWGVLRDGYTVPEFGRGGVWHFNEPIWTGAINEVKDSSGNNNHGTALNDASIIVNDTDVDDDTVDGNCAYFDGIDDYVEVHDAYSLDITDQITIEAWIKPFNIDVSGIARLMNQFGLTPYITHLYENLFAIVSEDQHDPHVGAGIIQTINITHYGNLSPILDTKNFGKSKPRKLRPIIAQVSDQVCVVAYNKNVIGDINNVHLKTFNISSNGSIGYTGNEVFDDNNSNIEGPNRPCIIKVTDGIFAIAYSINIDKNHPSVGIIKTVNISSEGKIEYTGNIAKFDNTSYEPSIVHVVGDLFAIAYRNHSGDGFIRTFNIYSNGTIVYTGNMLKFDNTSYEPSIAHVAGDLFAIAYRNHSGGGFIRTFNIYSNGTIKIIGTNTKFENSSCFYPHMIYHSKNYYLIVYATKPFGESEGYYKIIEIANNGSITILGPSISFEKEEKNRCKNPIAIKISERVFAIVYETKDPGGKTGHPGNLITRLVEYPSDVYSRGIYKLGSYGIYANATKVYGNINSKTISAPIIPDSWNYVVLTYNKDAPPDQMNMNLYVNGNLNASRDLSETIKITDSNLLFGDLFFGLIDEIAIHDKALDLDEIRIHYNNPGYFENEI
jgi:flagellin-like protein